MTRRPRVPPRESRYSDRSPERMPDRDPIPNKPASILNSATIAILIAVFVVGVFIGTSFSTISTTGQGTITTRYDIDQKAPSPEICLQYGASAITVDIRAFMTFSPFNAYISQPRMQPGCVIRSSNWGVLQGKNLITSQEANECKNRMNTFGFTGNLDNAENKPKIDCIYQTDAARNLFLDATGAGAPSDLDNFR
ncbi:MAG: DUF3172 domain-containing protein [Oscillatoriophycideae cyanobacterium NC_groundwater_1537_Pr4_S-0.65um_50_18]|nr:DUF3172 domain-containing protein [Oscillatoriophycideae cyanobacterium NC_groundwater_1537_Pr4_S-0.65um_50_18]